LCFCFEFLKFYLYLLKWFLQELVSLLGTVNGLQFLFQDNIYISKGDCLNGFFDWPAKTLNQAASIFMADHKHVKPERMKRLINWSSPQCITSLAKVDRQYFFKICTACNTWLIQQSLHGGVFVTEFWHARGRKTILGNKMYYNGTSSVWATSFPTSSVKRFWLIKMLLHFIKTHYLKEEPFWNIQ